MSVRRKNMLFALIGCIISALLGFYAFSNLSDSLSEITAYISAIAAGFSVIFGFITLNSSKSLDNIKRTIYISIPFSLGENDVSKIKSVFRRYPVCYSDELFKPGDKLQQTVAENTKNISVCFMIVSGELSPRQKTEVRELKQKGAKIVPVIQGEDTKIPTNLQDYQPISMESFLLMGSKSHEKENTK